MHSMTTSTSTSTPSKSRTRRSRLFLIPALIAASAAVLSVGPADANPTSKPINGHFELQAVTDGCASPLGLCFSGTMNGGLQGVLELTTTNVVPSGTPGLSYVESTSVLHTNRGDIFVASSAVVDLAGTSGGAFTSIDRIVGGTGEMAGASGYLQSRGFVVGTSDSGDYQGTLVLP